MNTLRYRDGCSNNGNCTGHDNIPLCVKYVIAVKVLYLTVITGAGCPTLRATEQTNTMRSRRRAAARYGVNFFA